MNTARSYPALLVLLLLASMTGCGQEVNADGAAVADLVASRLAPPPQEAAPMAAITTAVAMPNNLVAGQPSAPEDPAVSLASVLYSERDAEIGARTAGVLKAINTELGDQVKAGQLLAVLRDEEELAAVESALAAVDLAQLEYNRAMSLKEQNVITQAEIDQVAYRLRTARAALQEANVHLEYTRVRAPFSGVVTRRFVRAAQMVERGEPLFRVTALQPLRVLVRVPELDSQGLTRGQAVGLRSLEGRQVRGVIARIAPAVDPVSGTVEVLVDVPDPRGLRPGAAVIAEFKPGVLSGR